MHTHGVHTHTHTHAVHNTLGSVYLGQTLLECRLFQGLAWVCDQIPGAKDRPRPGPPALLGLKDDLPPAAQPSVPRGWRAGQTPTTCPSPPTSTDPSGRGSFLGQPARKPCVFRPASSPDHTAAPGPRESRNPAGIQLTAKPQFGGPVLSGIGRELISDGRTGRVCCHRLHSHLCWGAKRLF